MPKKCFGVWDFSAIFGVCGGAILCSFIAKDVKAGIFDSLYITIFPGDDG